MRKRACTRRSAMALLLLIPSLCESRTAYCVGFWRSIAAHCRGPYAEGVGCAPTCLTVAAQSLDELKRGCSRQSRRGPLASRCIEGPSMDGRSGPSILVMRWERWLMARPSCRNRALARSCFEPVARRKEPWLLRKLRYMGRCICCYFMYDCRQRRCTVATHSVLFLPWLLTLLEELLSLKRRVLQPRLD